MKKILAIVLVLCMALSIPAFAAFPQTWDEAKQNFLVSNALNAAGYDTWVPLLTDLYYLDWETEEPVLDTQASGFYVVPADCTFTYVNTGKTNDFFLWVGAKVYHKDEQGRYIFEDMPGESLRISGKFISQAADDTIGDYTLMKLGLGEGTVFGLDSLDVQNGDLVCLTFYQEYPAEQMYWYYSLCYMVDDALAAEMVADIDAEKAAEPGNPFTDVPADAYYHDAVLWALEKGITTGTSATTFSPETTCTRGQVVTFLWRAKGCPEPTTTENPFTDIKQGDYFYKPVLWAVENGITNGMTATTFGPGETCTSAHVVTFLWRANGKPAAETTGTNYYDEPVAWANSKQLLDGTAVPFSPTNLSPRADIVTYLYRDLAE